MIEYENITDLYEYQQQIKEEGKERKEYEKYIQCMNQYYSKDGQYIKRYEDGKLILAWKSDPSKTIVIEPAQFVNVHTLYIDLKKKLDELLLSS